MAEARLDVSSEDVSRSVARAVWGLLLIWTGAALFLHWGWGVGLIGAGVILLGAQAVRRALRVKVDGFALGAGLVLVLCGVWSIFEVAVELVPLLCIAAGVALLVSTWARRAHHAGGGGTDLHAPSHPRA